MSWSDEQAVQEAEYEFPYHHLPFIDPAGTAHLGRQMSWGFEYLAYTALALDTITQLGPRSVLDVGCGDGRLLHDIRSRLPDANLVGCDFSERAISFARAFSPNVDFVVSDVAEVPGQFNLVSCIETLEHIPDSELAAVVAAMGARIAPGGHLLISVPSVNLKMSAKHYRHYTLESLRASVESVLPGMEFLWGRYCTRTTRLHRWYLRLFERQSARLEVPSLRRIAWRRYLDDALNASPGDGLHIIACWLNPE